MTAPNHIVPVFPVDPAISAILRGEADEHPRWADVLCRRALCLLAEGNLPWAEEFFRRSLAVQPRYGWAMAGLAQTVALRGRHADAAALLHDAPEAAPGLLAWIRAFLGLVAGDVAAGEAALRDLPEGQGNRPDVLRLRAALARAGSREEAERLAGLAAEAFAREGISGDLCSPWDAHGDVAPRLITLVPALSRFWSEASELDARLGRPGDAHHAASLAHLHWADAGLLFLRRGNLAALLDEESSARHWYEKAAAASPELPDAHIALAYLWSAAGDLTQAETALRTALLRAPNYADLHHQLGLLRRARKDPEGALEAFQRAATINPRYALARLNEALTLAELERWESASQVFRIVMDLGLRSADILIHAGLVEERRGDDGAAAAAYREAILLQPEEPMAHYHLGNLHRRLGNRVEAKASWHRFLELSADTETARDLRAAMEAEADTDTESGSGEDRHDTEIR